MKVIREMGNRMTASRVVMIAALLVSPFSIVSADTVRLKNGNEMHGIILTRTNGIVQLQHSDGSIQQIPEHLVEKLSYRLSGIRSCLKTQTSPMLNCNVLLRDWQSGGIEVTYGPEFRDTQRIALQEIEQMTIWPAAGSELLRLNIAAFGEVEQRDGKILTGHLLRREGSLSVDGAVSTEIALDSIARISIKAGAFERSFQWRDLYPGYRRWRRDRSMLGLTTMAAFTASVLTGTTYWHASRVESQKSSGDPSTFLAGNAAYLRRYENYRRNMSIAGFFAAGIFMLNTADVIWIQSPYDVKTAGFVFDADERRCEAYECIDAGIGLAITIRF